MAKIESRRRARKLARTAIPVAAGLLLCAVIAAVILLPKACTGGKHAVVEDEPPYATGAVQATAEPPIVSELQQTAAATEISAAPSLTELVSPLPVQTGEDRSLVYCVVNASPQYSDKGDRLLKTEGSCAVSFVNNTDSAMFGAYFNMNGLTATSASAAGSAVRFENGDGSVLLPFVHELMPGESIDLYFEFSGSFSWDVGFELPSPAYETCFDAVCYVTSDSELTFSNGSASLKMNGSSYVYLLEAQKVYSISVKPS